MTADVPPETGQPLPTWVRRLLVGVFVVLAVGVVSGVLWLATQSPRAESNATQLRWQASAPQQLAVPCFPWLAPDGKTFVCERDGAVWRGERGSEAATRLDVAFPPGAVALKQVEWLPNGAAFVLLFATPTPRSDDETASPWPVRLVRLADETITPLPDAVPGAHLQRLPDGVAYPSREALVVWRQGALATVPTGQNATVYPHVMDVIHLAPGATDAETVLARLVVGQSGAVLRVMTLREGRRDERQVDMRLYRGEQVFAWSPSGAWLAYANREERLRTPALWVTMVDGRTRYQIWKANAQGKIDFLNWLDESTLFFAFVPDGARAAARTRFFLADATRSAGTTIPLWEGGRSPVLARDGRSLVFARGEGANETYWMVRFDARE
nr:hypothetical protein [Ardenticatena sp.]